MNEIAALNRLVYDALTSDETLSALVTGAYLRRAPQGAAYPYALFTPQSAVDINTVSASRALTNLVYNVQVVGVNETSADSDAFEAAAARLDAVLTGAEGVVEADEALGRPAISVSGLHRESSFQYDEPSSQGAPVEHCGGLYRAFVQIAA